MLRNNGEPPPEATPRPALGHALPPFHPDLPVTASRPTASGRLGRGIVVGATATLALTLLPGTAAADPEQASSAARAAQLVAVAGHELEVVTEQVNEARETLGRQQAAVQDADRAAAEAHRRLGALDGQIRQVARTAFTGDGMTELDLLLTSESPEDFVSSPAVLDVIAGHTDDVLADVADSAAAAQRAQARRSRPRTPVWPWADPAPAAAASGTAQAAVDTVLAQVGDAYVWGAGGPDSFDCSRLTQYAYAAAGISLPHSSRMQAAMGTAVSRAGLQPGDLIFHHSPVSHVSMYIGNGQMVHASTSGQPVRVVGVDSMGGITAMRRIP